MGAPGFPVEFGGVDELHATFLNESRTRGPVKPHTRVLVAPRAGNPDTWAENDMFRSLFLASPWMCWR